MRFSTGAGAAAGILALSLGLGSVAGAVWGLTRPGYVGSLSEGSYVVDEVASPPSVEFASLGGFVLVSAVLGLVIASFAFARGLVGVRALFWVIACAGAAAFAVHTFGSWSAACAHPSPHDATLADGAGFSVVPPLDPGVGWLSGPFVAALMFYLLTIAAELQAPLREAPPVSLQPALASEPPTRP